MLRRIACRLGWHGRLIYVGRMFAGYTDAGMRHYRGRYLCEQCQHEHWFSHYEPMTWKEREARGLEV
jgi:hypothetical protein